MATFNPKTLKKWLVFGILGVVGFFAFFTLVHAASIFIVQQGGTGVGTFTSSNLIYGNGTSPLSSVATTSVTCSGSTTCTTFTAIGASPITISSTAGGGSGNVATSTHEVSGQVAVFSSNSATPATIAGNTGLIFDGANLGINSPTLANELEVGGSAVIGTQNLNVAAPANGLLVQGKAVFGATTTSAIGGASGPPAIGVYVNATSPFTNTGQFTNALAIAQINPNQTDGTYAGNDFGEINSAGSPFITARIAAINTAHTAGSEAGELKFLTANAGTLGVAEYLTSTNQASFGGSATQAASNLYSTFNITATSSNTTSLPPLVIYGNRVAYSNGTKIGGFGVVSADSNFTLATGPLVTEITSISEETQTAATQATGIGFYTTATGGTATDTEKMYLSGAGNLGIGTVNPIAQLNIGGTYTSANVTPLYINTALVSSGTGSQYGGLIQPSFNPSGASLTTVSGLSEAPAMAAAATVSPTNFFGNQAFLTLNAGFAGTIVNGRDFQAGSTVVNGANPITNFTEFYAATINNGDATTTGTVTNIGFFGQGISAASAGSATLNNRTAQLTVPSGSPAGGTTNNRGLYITGNGGTSGGGTVNNYALYSDSTANSYFAGNVGIGTTSPYALLSIGGNVVVGASTAGGTLGDLYLPKLGTAAGAFLAVDPTGKVIATTTPAGGGAVSSVSNSDGTLTISPTTGAVVASLALSHANTWTGQQIFNSPPVGIGTTSPFAQLSVSTTTASSASTWLFDVASSTNATLLNILGSGFMGLGTSSPKGLFSMQTITNAINAFTLSNSIGSTTLRADTVDTGAYTFSVSSSTDSTSVIRFGIDAKGHMVTGGTAPTLSSCGGSPAVTGDDNSGTITIGSGVVTACTITFAQTWTNTPTCTISDNSTTVTIDVSSLSTSALGISSSATIGGGTVYYQCQMHGP